MTDLTDGITSEVYCPTVLETESFAQVSKPCTIPSFTYLYPTKTISPREGSAFVCTKRVDNPVDNQGSNFETSLHGIAISAPLTNSETNYIGKQAIKKNKVCCPFWTNHNRAAFSTCLLDDSKFAPQTI